MTILEQSKVFYLNINKDIEQIMCRIEKRKKQIIRLENKANKLYDKGFWGELLIRPIMEMVKDKFPKITWDDDKLTPMGLCSRISLFGNVNGKTIILCFTPSNLDMGIIAYDTEEESNEKYPENSLGAWNQMGKVSEDIENIEQIYSHIEKQIKKSDENQR